MQSVASTPEAGSWILLAQFVFVAIQLFGIACFCYIVKKRLAPMLAAERDFRFDRPLQRMRNVLQYWLGQWRHPRYPGAGVLHILIFAGFIILALRSFTLLIAGMPGALGTVESASGIAHYYGIVTDYAATVVFICMIVAAVRRIVFKPARYAVPPKYGKGHPVDAIFLLVLIAILMFADSLFAASEPGALIGPLSLAWALRLFIGSATLATVWNISRRPRCCTRRRFTSCCAIGHSAFSSTWRHHCLTCTSPSSTAEQSSR